MQPRRWFRRRTAAPAPTLPTQPPGTPGRCQPRRGGRSASRPTIIFAQDPPDCCPGAPGRPALLGRCPAAALLAGTALAVPAQAAAGHPAAPADGSGGRGLTPGDLLVSGSTFTNDPAIVAGETVLPPGCTSGCVRANADGTYPQVFNNDAVDGSFGITSPIFLDQLTPWRRGRPGPADRAMPGGGRGADGDQLLVQVGAGAEPVHQRPVRDVHGLRRAGGGIDVSNANTPGVIDPTNPVPSAYYRVVAKLDADGRFRFTETNAYSGNNGRAAILNDAG